ncbi:MAG: HepT-like ribonuclease domain-containing protein [Patescibacteria group bacterium]
MAGYRNRLVHLYWNVSKEEVLNTLQNELSDFQEFIGYIENFLAKE